MFEVSASDPIKADVERVLALKFGWQKDRIAHATAFLWTLAHPAIPQQTIADCIDTDDNRVLECALDAHAQVIVMGDNHLLGLHPYRKISILTPRQFLEATPWRI